MKVILTEEQYQILEDIINEVSNNYFTKTIDVGSVVKIIQGDGDSEELKVTKLLDRDKFIEANDDSQKHLFSLTSALNSERNTFTTVKRGIYIPSQKGVEAVIELGENGVETPFTNVSRVEIYNPNGKLVDTIHTKLGKVDKDKSDLDKEEKLNKRLEFERNIDKKLSDKERRIYDLVLNNPTLKKAFYHQPKLLGGLLNFGKAKGIGPAQDLISKYLKRYDDGKKDKATGDFKKFKINHGVRFEVLNKPIRMGGDNKKLEIDVGSAYPARYTEKQYIQGSIGRREDKVPFKIYLAEKYGDDIYKGTIKGFFKEKGEDKIVEKMDNIIIKIIDYNYG